VVPERKELKVLLEVLDFRVPKAVKDFKDNKETKVPQDPEDLKDPLALKEEYREHRDSLEEVLLERKELLELKVLLELRGLRVHRMLDSRKT
jgi:hypothetical protein